MMNRSISGWIYNHTPSKFNKSTLKNAGTGRPGNFSGFMLNLGGEGRCTGDGSKFQLTRSPFCVLPPTSMIQNSWTIRPADTIFINMTNLWSLWYTKFGAIATSSHRSRCFLLVIFQNMFPKWDWIGWFPPSPWSLTWTWRSAPLKKRFLLETNIFRFHVKLLGGNNVANQTSLQHLQKKRGKAEAKLKSWGALHLQFPWLCERWEIPMFFGGEKTPLNHWNSSQKSIWTLFSMEGMCLLFIGTFPLSSAREDNDDLQCLLSRLCTNSNTVGKEVFEVYFADVYTLGAPPKPWELVGKSGKFDEILGGFHAGVNTPAKIFILSQLCRLGLGLLIRFNMLLETFGKSGFEHNAIGAESMIV